MRCAGANENKAGQKAHKQDTRLIVYFTIGQIRVQDQHENNTIISTVHSNDNQPQMSASRVYLAGKMRISNIGGGIMYSTCRRRRSNYTDCTLVPMKVSGITTKRNHGNLCFLCRMPFHHDRKNIGSGWRSFYFWKKILVGFITTVVVITFGSFKIQPPSNPSVVQE